MKLKHILIGLVVLVVLIIGGVFVALKSIDFNEYRSVIADQTKQLTGRDLRIAGELQVGLSLTPTVAVDDVTFANAPWGSRPEMATIKRFETELELIPLIFGDIQVNRVVLKGADILLETDAKGQNNWTFGEAGAAGQETAPSGGGAGKLPVVNKITFEDVTITYKDGVAKKTQTVAFEKFSADMADANSPIALEIVANLNGNPISATGAIGSLSGIVANQPLPIDLKGQGGGATFAAKGTIEQPAAGKGVAIALSAEGQSLADMTPLAGSPMPALGPYSFSGNLSDAKGGYQVAGMQMKMGGSDIAGDASIALSGERPKIVANLSSSLLDAKDFGIKPAPAEGAVPAATKSDGRVFPDDPLPFDLLKAVDAKIDFTGQKVIREPVTFDGLAVALDLTGGKLTIGKIDAGVTGGKLGLSGVIDGSAKTPAVALKLTSRGIEAGTLMHTLGQSAILSGGKMDTDIDVKGAGSSVRQIMAGLNGNVDMEMGSGKINNRFARIILSDLFQLISTGSADSSNLNCFVTRFDIAKGVATSKALALDTNGATIHGSGKINLGSEKLDMKLDPAAKQTNLIQLAIPVNVRGTLASPSVTPDPAGLVKGVGALAGTAGDGDAVGALTGLVTGATGSGTAQPAPASGGCGAVAAKAPEPAAIEPAQQPAAQPESATDQLLQQGTEQGKKGVEDAVKGLFGD